MALDFRNSFARLEIPRAYMIPDPFKRPARASGCACLDLSGATNVGTSWRKSRLAAAAVGARPPLRCPPLRMPHAPWAWLYQYVRYMVLGTALGT